MSLKSLADFCRRVGTSLKAGVDVRKVFQREAERGSARERVRLGTVRDSIQRGQPIHEAMTAAEGYFPPLLIEMSGVGEKTGKTAEVLLRMAEHYDHLLTLRRVFLAAITWPMLQLTIAILVIGGVIGLLGVIGQKTGETHDILGFGLIGMSGMAIYFSIVGVFGFGMFLLIRALVQGKLSASLMGLLMNVPGLGPQLRTMAVARMAWSLALAIEAGMDAKNSVRVALESTRNQFFMRHQKDIQRGLAQHREIHEVLRDTEAFPIDFLDALETGETAGRLAETMQVLSDQYTDRGRSASRFLTAIVTAAVWITVAAFLIFMIFRIALAYVGIYTDLFHELGI